MSVKRRFSTRWGHHYHLQGACAKCRQTLLRSLCSITPMIPESYTEWPAQSKGEDPSDGGHHAIEEQQGPQVSHAAAGTPAQPNEQSAHWEKVPRPPAVQQP